MAWLEQSPKDQQAFFKKSLLRSKTSFSSETRIDDGFSFANAIPDWKHQGSIGGTHSRPRIIRFLGALKKTPGPGAYDDHDELRSNLESAPAYSISTRNFPGKISTWSDPGPGKYDMPNVLDKYEVIKGKRKVTPASPPKCKCIVSFCIFI